MPENGGRELSCAAAELDIWNHGKTNLRRHGSTEKRIYGNTERRINGNTEAARPVRQRRGKVLLS